jgi:hypothetical protein
MIIKRESILFTWPEFVNRVGVKIDRDFGKNSKVPDENPDAWKQTVQELSAQTGCGK